MKSRLLLTPFSEQKVFECGNICVSQLWSSLLTKMKALPEVEVLFKQKVTDSPSTSSFVGPIVISLPYYQQASNYLSGCFRLPGGNYCSKGPINSVVWCISLTSPG